MEQVDERQLAQLFQTAAGDGPPASFGHSDVVAASHRETRRRRTRIAGGSALVVAVLLGGVAVGNNLLGGPRNAETTSAGGLADSTHQSAEAERAEPAPDEQQPGTLSSPDSQSQGTDKSGEVIPWPGLAEDDARAGCGPADRELADALAAQLPAAAQNAPIAVPDACPPGARAVAVPVSEDGADGWIYLVLAPVRGDGPADQPVERADGALGFQRLTPSGRVLVVLSVPAVDNGQPPFAADTMILAEEIGSKF